MDSSEFNEWFRMAQKDIRSARILFQYDADNEIVCFHCQQAIEKYLKGYLVFINGELQEGHSLIKLCKKAMLRENSFGELLKDMAYVNTFYLETRYPAVDPLLVSIEDAEECLKITDKVLSKIEQLVAAK